MMIFNGIKTKYVTLLLLALICAIALVGCGKEKEEEYYETTLEFGKNGSITDVIVDSFSESYYTEEGLRSFFQEKISDYNSTNAGRGDIALGELSVENGRAKAVIEFESADDYKSFYGTVAFYGSVSKAYDEGYITEITLKDIKSNQMISKNDLMKMKDETIIIVSEVVRVKSPKKILYTSANVEVIDDKTVRVSSDSSGLAYILVK